MSEDVEKNETQPEKSAPHSGGPSKQFMTTLIVIIVLFVLIWIGLKWYQNSGEGNQGAAAAVPETTQTVPAPPAPPAP